MKFSTSVQDNESFVPSNASTKVSATEYEPLVDQYIPLKNKIPRSIGFSFGSSTLAIIYMANTMVIPDMNQIQNEINFNSIKMLAITIFQYLSFMMCICIPSYMMIKQCEKHNSPFYNQVLSEINPQLGRSFLWANIMINILALFNLAIRLVNFVLNSAPCMYRPFQDIIQHSQDNRFFLVWSAFCLSAIVLLYGIRCVSYFENFNQIQGRLLLTFLGKWILFLTIFIVLYFQNDCSNSPVPGESIIQKFDTTSLINYYFSIIYCLSFPFMEIFYIKRETRTDNKSSFYTVKKVYKTQLILRASFFFMQILGWGLLSQMLGKDQFLQCSGQLQIQFILMILTLLTITTVGPIYANNYSLNRQILSGKFMDSTKLIHKQLIDEAFTLCGLMVTILYIAVILIRVASQKYWIYHYVLIDFTQAIQACCFGYACLTLPLLVQAKQETSQVKSMMYAMFCFLSVGVYGICITGPILGALDV